MLICLFIINFILIFNFPVNFKKDYFFSFQPLLFLLIVFIIKKFQRILFVYNAFREEEKIIKEVPALIDFLKSYLCAGLLLPPAITAVLKQRKWCYPIQNSLGIICGEYAQGKSIKDSICSGIYYTKLNKKRQYLCLLYLSLKLGCSTGENMTHILEKVKHKTEDRLNLERKLKLTTAQMRLQSLVIILAPLFLAFILYLISPEYILFFFNTLAGRLLLALMIFLNFLGAYFLNKILRIQ